MPDGGDPPLAGPAPIEVTDSHQATVGGATVRRALPRRGRRTVGAWCFADHFGPAAVTENAGMDVGPHPHMGLHTVTWLVEGQLLHRDSLGSEQVIRPGQLNLMTAGAGIAHAEEATGQHLGTLQGIQLWVAQPDAVRFGSAAFEHHGALPQVEVDGGVATVLIGELGGARSTARADTPLIGAELLLRSSTTVPLQAGFEHALVVLDGAVAVDGQPLVPGRVGVLGLGRDEVVLDVRERARVMLLGGEPFESPILMWWNYVARSREEIDAAHASWSQQDDRFGRVRSRLPLIPAAPPFWQAASGE
ncbi:MAG: pirin family protein [Acidimicrobiales bacterium]|nr:pirin family protein [Acidimicrobiales bacterium]